jgi:uncharacterized protein (DUF952 family)
VKILHITGQKDWQKALEEGAYLADTLAEQGFIHCCLDSQLEGVLREWFAGATDLVLLEIESDRLASPLKFESTPDGQEKFPHVYGPINLEAVAEVKPIQD